MYFYQIKSIPSFRLRSQCWPLLWSRSLKRNVHQVGSRNSLIIHNSLQKSKIFTSLTSLLQRKKNIAYLNLTTININIFNFSADVAWSYHGKPVKFLNNFLNGLSVLWYLLQKSKGGRNIFRLAEVTISHQSICGPPLPRGFLMPSLRFKTITNCILKWLPTMGTLVYNILSVIIGYDVIIIFRISLLLHTVQFKFQSLPGVQMPSVRNGGLKKRYIFEQLHFHWGSNSNRGSEHYLNGRS